MKSGVYEAINQADYNEIELLSKFDSKRKLETLLLTISQIEEEEDQILNSALCSFDSLEAEIKDKIKNVSSEIKDVIDLINFHKNDFLNIKNNNQSFFQKFLPCAIHAKNLEMTIKLLESLKHAISNMTDFLFAVDEVLIKDATLAIESYFELVSNLPKSNESYRVFINEFILSSKIKKDNSLSIQRIASRVAKLNPNLRTIIANIIIENFLDNSIFVANQIKTIDQYILVVTETWYEKAKICLPDPVFLDDINKYLDLKVISYIEDIKPESIKSENIFRIEDTFNKSLKFKEQNNYNFRFIQKLAPFCVERIFSQCDIKLNSYIDGIKNSRDVLPIDGCYLSLYINFYTDCESLTDKIYNDLISKLPPETEEEIPSCKMIWEKTAFIMKKYMISMHIQLKGKLKNGQNLEQKIFSFNSLIALVNHNKKIQETYKYYLFTEFSNDISVGPPIFDLLASSFFNPDVFKSWNKQKEDEIRLNLKAIKFGKRGCEETKAGFVHKLYTNEITALVNFVADYIKREKPCLEVAKNIVDFTKSALNEMMESKIKDFKQYQDVLDQFICFLSTKDESNKRKIEIYDSKLQESLNFIMQAKKIT